MLKRHACSTEQAKATAELSRDSGSQNDVRVTSLGLRVTFLFLAESLKAHTLRE